MIQLGIFQILLAWDASPLQGYPLSNIKFAGAFLYPWVFSSTIAQEHTAVMQCPRPGFEPGPLQLESSALTMATVPPPPHRNKSWSLCALILFFIVLLMENWECKLYLYYEFP